MGARTPEGSAPDAGSWARAEALFAELVELGPAERRRRFGEIRSQDPEAARWVERLLRADSELNDEGGDQFLAPRREGLLDWVEGGGGAEPLTFSLEPGDEVGPFVIERGIGRGGMGEVYRARRRQSQDEAGFEQTVALKVIRPGEGGPTEEIRLRFFRERRILARLTHPAIGRLLDGGTAADGRPYFAMELVDGEPITTFCADHDLSLRRRLELFGEVCGAVQFAHENLIVHRDLKPSNVLVVEPSTGSGHGHPSVKLLDFGIAGLLEADFDEGLTRTGMAPATPQYAAPEQLRGEPVQAATDVYALGILLFELVTGERPEDWPPRAAAETLRTPPSPARVAGSSGRDCPRDLAAIVMRAIEAEPERRYGSVAALAADLERFLEGRPVQARKGTRWYRAGKFLARNRVALALGASALAALLVGLVAARIQAEEAGRQAERARRSTELLTRVFEGSDPAATQGREVTALDLLDNGSRQIEQDLAGDPALRAELQTVLARIYRSLGAYERSRGLATSALEAASEGSASSPRSLRGRAVLEGAQADLALGRAQAAVEALEKEIDGGSVGDSALDAELGTAYAAALLELGRAEQANRVAVDLALSAEIRERPALHARVLALRADSEAALGRPAEAATLHREVVDLLEAELDPPHPDLARAWSDLGVALLGTGAYEQAQDPLQRALAARRQLYGERHAEVADSLRNLSGVERALGNREGGMAMLEQAVSIYRENFGDAHPDTAEAINNLAVATVQAGQLAAAVPLFEQAVASTRAAFDSKHPGLILPLASLGNLESTLGRLESAERTLTEARSLSTELLSTEHPQRALVANQLAGLRAKQGRTEEAIPLLEEALQGFRASLGEEHPNVGIVLATLGQLELGLAGSSASSLESAEGHLSRATELLQSAPAPLQPHRVRAQLGWGEALFRTGREAEAVDQWSRLLENAAAGEAVAGPDRMARLCRIAEGVSAVEGAWRVRAQAQRAPWLTPLDAILEQAVDCPIP